MSERFLKLIMSKEFDYLLSKHPNAFLLLVLIGSRARRYDGEPDGLIIGDALIGDYEACGLTRQEYRTALDILERRCHIRIVETCRTRQKSTNGSTTKGTKVRILRSDVCDINPEYHNQSTNHRPTTDQPPTNHEQDRINTEQELIDHDLIDAQGNADNSEVLQFDLKKGGVVRSTFNQVTEILKKDDWSEKEINQAIEKMKNFNPSLNGKIEAYLTTILKTQKKEPKTCKSSPQKKKKEGSSKDSGYFMGSDLSEAPLAKYARQNGYKS